MRVPSPIIPSPLGNSASTNTVQTLPAAQETTLVNYRMSYRFSFLDRRRHATVGATVSSLIDYQPETELMDLSPSLLFLWFSVTKEEESQWTDVLQWNRCLIIGRVVFGVCTQTFTDERTDRRTDRRRDGRRTDGRTDERIWAIAISRKTSDGHAGEGKRELWI